MCFIVYQIKYKFLNLEKMNFQTILTVFQLIVNSDELLKRRHDETIEDHLT
jgi:hypothetical protein